MIITVSSVAINSFNKRVATSQEGTKVTVPEKEKITKGTKISCIPMSFTDKVTGVVVNYIKFIEVI